MHKYECKHSEHPIILLPYYITPHALKFDFQKRSRLNLGVQTKPYFSESKFFKVGSKTPQLFSSELHPKVTDMFT